LRAAREAAGLTISDIAEVLRFSAHQIEALERDDYAHLAGNTLVRGMVRGYAKLLKINPEPLLSGLDGNVKPNTADVRAPTNIGVADKTTTVTRLSRGAALALGLFALLFTLVAGYVYVMADEPASRMVSTTSEAPLSISTTLPVPPAPPAQAPTNSAAAVPDPAALPPAAVPANATPANTLVIDFDDLSWVEIADASQSIVFRGEFPKGTHRVVEGKPPFQLWIGRASAVRVSFGERLIDLKPFSRDNVARLSVE
jgi:cytoskeleton protein RodZ